MKGARRICYRETCGHLVKFHGPDGCTWSGCICKAVVISLTPREFDILRGIILDGGCKNIAVKRNISVKTVQSHRWNILTKTNCHTIVELVGFALNKGIVKIEELYKPTVEIGVVNELN